MSSRVSIFAALMLVACKPTPQPAQPAECSRKLQVLVRGVAPLNPNDEGEQQLVNVTLYQLSGRTSLNQLDFAAVHEDAKSVFGDEYVGKYELAVSPDTGEKYPLELKKEVTHIVAVANFYQTIGNAWFAIVPVPKPACGGPPSCIYLKFERTEVVGSGSRPPGFDSPAFDLRCVEPSVGAK